MIPMPMPLSGPPPKRPRVPVDLPSRALLARSWVAQQEVPDDQDQAGGE